MKLSWNVECRVFQVFGIELAYCTLVIVDERDFGLKLDQYVVAFASLVSFRVVVCYVVDYFALEVILGALAHK